MPLSLGQVAAQIYTVRDFLRTPQDVARSFKRLRSIGYQAVELAGLCELSDSDLTRILDGEGLVCCSSHESPARILEQPCAVADHLAALKCSFLAYPYPANVPLNALDEVKAFAAQLNAAGRNFHDAGLTLAYHNHQIEFRRVAGRTILEILYAETDPRYLQAELDTHWVQTGGGNPIAWCERMTGRLPLLHLKDYAISAENRSVFAEVGSGNLDWGGILAAAEHAGCRWYIVEQDVCPGDPFESLARSFTYLRDRWVRA